MLDDWRASAVTGKLRAALGLVEKLTLTPAAVSAADIVPLRQAGLGDRAIIDALYICVGFNVIVRIADALEFTVPPPQVFRRSVGYLLRFGYKLLSGKWFGGAPVSLAAAAGPELVHDPYAPGISALKKSVLTAPGWLPPELRAAALDAARLPAPTELLGAYVSAVRQHAWEITDGDLAALRAAGQSEDQIFELTVCASVGAGLVRLERGLGALRQAASQG